MHPLVLITSQIYYQSTGLLSSFIQDVCADIRHVLTVSKTKAIKEGSMTEIVNGYQASLFPTLARLGV